VTPEPPKARKARFLRAIAFSLFKTRRTPAIFQKFSKLLDRITQRKEPTLRLVLRDDGASLLDGSCEIWAFQWDAVNLIQTYKQDLYTVDMICLDFFTDGQQSAYHTNDDMEGFDILCQNLRRYFPSIPEDWWSQVAFPAFASNHNVLYDRTRSVGFSI
jgi:hypothetical protein